MSHTLVTGRSARARRVMLAAVVLGCGAWAFWPLRPASPLAGHDGAALPPASGDPSSTPDRFDLVAYQTPLWVAPPPAPAPPPPPPAIPPPPLLKLQLLAIIQSGDSGASGGTTYSAMFYDPDAGKILVLKEGDAIPSGGGGGAGGGASTTRSIAKVTARDVQIREPAVNGRAAMVSTISIPAPNTALPKGGG